MWKHTGELKMQDEMLNANPAAPAVDAVDAADETETTEDDAVQVDPGDVVRQIIVDVVEEMGDTRLAPTSLETLKKAFTESRQVQLGMEGVEEKFVFDFKPVSPEQVMMQTTVLIPPELEQYTRLVDPGKTPPPTPPRAQQQLNRISQQREAEIMWIAVCMAVTNPKLAPDRSKPDAFCVDDLPTNIFRSLFDAIWSASLPSTQNEWMRMFQRAGANRNGTG